MAKLNKMEISAIADKIYSDIKKKIKDSNNKVESGFDEWFAKFKTTSDFMKIETIISYCKDISKKYKNCDIPYHISNLATYTEEAVAKGVFKKTIKLKECNIKVEEIRNDIIIAQAKNEDLDKLIKDLTEKYSA